MNWVKPLHRWILDPVVFVLRVFAALAYHDGDVDGTATFVLMAFGLSDRKCRNIDFWEFYITRTEQGKHLITHPTGHNILERIYQRTSRHDR